MVDRTPRPRDYPRALSDKGMRSHIFDGLIAGVTALFALALYARTLVPGLLPGDGGEFQTLAETLGHAHTTGYEVYMLLAHAFTRLVPWGDIAYRVNLFSAVCGALTVGLVYLAGRVLSGSRWAGLLGALALAISATFWSQAIIAEVYTAGSVFTAAILLLVLLWYTTRRGHFLFAAGMLGGLAIGVHNTNSLFAPAIALLLLICWRDLGRTWKPARRGGAALLGVGLGLALFAGAFLVIDAHTTPTSSVQSIYQPSISRWDGQPQELDTLTGRFAFLVGARQWRSAMFSGDPSVPRRNGESYMAFLPRDFAPVLLGLAGLGLAALFARRWRLGVFFSAALLVHTVYTLNYAIGDIYVFYVSLYVYLCVLMAQGAAVLLGLAGRLPGWLGRAAVPALALLLMALAAAPVLPQRAAALQAGAIRFDFMNLMSNRELQGWHALIAENVRQLPPDALVLTDWGQLYPSYYAAVVEQGRGDLRFLETYPYATKRPLADTLIDYVKAQMAQGRPVYSEREIPEMRRGGLSMRETVIGTRRVFQIVAAAD